MGWSEWKNLGNGMHFDLIRCSDAYGSTFEFTLTDISMIHIEKIEAYPHLTGGWELNASLTIVDNSTGTQIYTQTWSSGTNKGVATVYNDINIDLSEYANESLTIKLFLPAGGTPTKLMGAYMYNVDIS